jgi:hypothetical protein
MLGWNAMWRSAGFCPGQISANLDILYDVSLTAFFVVHLQPLDRCTNIHYHM